MIDYYEALKEMHKGNVVKYVGTVKVTENGMRIYFNND